MKTLLSVLFFAFALITVSSLVVGLAGEFGSSTTVWGNVTIGTSSASGAVIDVYLGSGSTPSQTFTVGSQGPGVPSGYYQADVGCDNTSAVFVKVWGINGTATGCRYGIRTEANISVSAVSNGAACSYANACSGGYCCSGATAINTSGGSGTCQASACAAAAAAVDTGGGGGGAGAGGGGAAAPAPTPPSQETIDVVKEALPEAFKEADAAGNVEIKTVAAPVITEVPVAPETVTKTLEQLETIVKTEEAKQALSAIQEAVSSGGASTVSVKKTIEVVKATNKVTNEEVVVSVVKLAVPAPGNQDLKNVEVVEVIPKAAASNVNQVTFKGDQPQVLEADPVVKWFFSQVTKGTTKDLSYTVNKDIRNIGTTTVGVQGRAEAAPSVQPPAVPEKKEEEAKAIIPPAKKPTPVGTAALVVIVVLLVVAGWFFVKSRKRPMK